MLVMRISLFTKILSTDEQFCPLLLSVKQAREKLEFHHFWQMKFYLLIPHFVLQTKRHDVLAILLFICGLKFVRWTYMTHTNSGYGLCQLYGLAITEATKRISDWFFTFLWVIRTLRTIRIKSGTFFIYCCCFSSIENQAH